MSRMFDREGNELGWFEGAMLFEHSDRNVARTELGDVVVSTVHLVLDHSFRQEGPPLIFETMVFGGINDQWQMRHHTEPDALYPHERVVEALAMGWDLEDLPHGSNCFFRDNPGSTAGDRRAEGSD